MENIYLPIKDNIQKWSKNINTTLTVDAWAEGYTGNVGLITNYVKDLKIDNLEFKKWALKDVSLGLKAEVKEVIYW